MEVLLQAVRLTEIVVTASDNRTVKFVLQVKTEEIAAFDAGCPATRLRHTQKRRSINYHRKYRHTTSLALKWM